MTGSETPQPAPANAPPARPRRRWRRVAIVAGVLVAAPVLLFVINGMFCARGETPELHVLSDEPAASEESAPLTIKVFSFNIAKCFVLKDGRGIEDRQVVARRVERIAELIRAEQPDFVFLCEAVVECGPCPTNQPEELARATGMHAWAFGENYNFGLPFYRIAGGNAILSRRPLEAVANPPLAGRRPFYVTKNNRRALWCAAEIDGRRVLLAAIHTDSFRRENNLRQTEQILEFCSGSDAILAGDFNARPDEPSIELVRRSGQFSGAFDGEQTFPSSSPNQRIDFIFAPASWELLEEHVVDSDVSDHRAVVSTFRVVW